MKVVREKQKRGGKLPAPRPPAGCSPARGLSRLAQARAAHRGALVVALIAYSNSFSGGFVFDNSILMQDSRIKAVTPENIDLILTQEYWYNWSLTGLYRPLTTFSYLFNYAILGNGTQPAGYHWINFGLHAINIALVYALGLMLLGEIAPAFALAAVWSLHPLLTESVTNIVGRSDMLAAFGVLGVLLCHITAASAAGGARLAWLLGLVLVGARRPVLEGEHRGGGGGDAALRSHLPRAEILARARSRVRGAGPAALLLPYVRYQVLSKIPAEQIAYTDNPVYGIEFWTARLTAIKVIGKYLWLLVWPGQLVLRLFL